MHPRKVIRHAVTAALINATAAKRRVFPTRKIQHLLDELPLIAVYSLNEDSELDIQPRELDRDLQILIECFVEATGADDQVDDLMDDLAEEVERVMNTDYTFDCAAYESNLVSTDLESVADADREIGIVEMIYSFKYRTDAFNEEDAEITDYERSTAAIDLEGEQAVADQTFAEFEQEE